MGMSEFDPAASDRRAWNAGRKVGAKRALKPRQVWAIRFFLDKHRRLRNRALFDLAIDSKLRGCDVVRMKIGDLVLGGQIRAEQSSWQQKTGRPVQFELLTDARASLLAWLERRGGTVGDYVFPSRVDQALITFTSARDNTRDSSMNGSAVSDYAVRSMAPIRFAGQRHRSSTRPPATFAPCRYYSAIPRSRTPCDILASTWRMLLCWRRVSRSKPPGSLLPARSRTATRRCRLTEEAILPTSRHLERLVIQHLGIASASRSRLCGILGHNGSTRNSTPRGIHFF